MEETTPVSHKGSNEENSVSGSFAEVFRAELGAVKTRRINSGQPEDTDILSIDSTNLTAPSSTLLSVLDQLHGNTSAWQNLGSASPPEADSPEATRHSDTASATIAPTQAKDRLERPRAGLVGLALSGGGIRSSSFNLGVLQAVHRAGLFGHLDYLSTVSGGGYIGTYLSTSIMEEHTEAKESTTEPDEVQDPERAEENGETAEAPGKDYFPFLHKTGQVESPRFRHLRNYASYLTPGGKSELLSAPIVLLRGMVVNTLCILPWLLGLALILGTSMDYNWRYRFMQTDWLYSYGIHDLLYQCCGAAQWPVIFQLFPMTFALLAVLLVSFCIYPIVLRLVYARLKLSECALRSRREELLTLLRGLVALALVLAFIELQPVVLSHMEHLKEWLATLVGASTVAIMVSDKLLSRLGSLRAMLGVSVYGILGALALWLLLLFFTRKVADGSWSVESVLVVITVLGVYAYWFVDVNAISLHKYYRDHLVKAFVAQAAGDDVARERGVQSKKGGQQASSGNHAGTTAVKADQARGGATPGSESASNEEPGWQQRLLQEEVRVPRLADMNTSHAPYHLINAAVNVRRAEVEYRSGRGASFFFFSPQYCGGIRTGYMKTRELESVAKHLDVGTAMAISGAAIAPNMGKATNRLLCFVLSLLNVRLNYWLPNPKCILHRKFKRPTWARFTGAGPSYLFREMLNLLDAESPYVNLSDGGHVENLGLYELLRRQCRLIIVGDGECDKTLTFEGLAEAIRLARIDFGFWIEMDGLDEIRCGDQQFATGTIYYDDKRQGKLIYIKSNLGGDHNLQATLQEEFYRTSASRDDDYLFDDSAYVAHYKRNHPDFPHESTADQFFDEAQFEAYRALGYQVAKSALIAPDDAAVANANTVPEEVTP